MIMHDNIFIFLNYTLFFTVKLNTVGLVQFSASCPTFRRQAELNTHKALSLYFT